MVIKYSKRQIFEYNGTLTTSEILQTSDYYAFEREITYSPAIVTNPEDNYKYNGKEYQKDLSEYDYGARFYDPIIARWTSVDPMAEKYTLSSPYQYTADNPVNYIDPNGAELDVWGSAEPPSSAADILVNVQNGNMVKVRFDGSTAINTETGLKYKGKDDFISAVSNALSSLNNTETGRELVEFAESLEDQIEIQHTQTNGTSDDGLAVGWNPALLNGGPTEKNTTDRPAFIGLGHELAHVQDVFAILSEPGDWTKEIDGFGNEVLDKDGNPKMLSNSEKYATYKENQLRAENNVSLRKSYDANSDAPILKNHQNRWYRSNPIIVPRPHKLNFKILPQKL